MKTLTIYALPNETPFQAVRRVVKELEKAFDVEIGLELEIAPMGRTYITAHISASVLELTHISEEEWKAIRDNIQAVADRALRGSGARK